MSIDITKARKSAQRLIDVAFGNRDKETGEKIRPHFEIPANPRYDDDLILSAALDELERLQLTTTVQETAAKMGSLPMPSAAEPEKKGDAPCE